VIVFLFTSRHYYKFLHTLYLAFGHKIALKLVYIVIENFVNVFKMIVIKLYCKANIFWWE